MRAALMFIFLVVAYQIGSSETVIGIPTKMCSLDTASIKMTCEQNTEKFELKREKDTWSVKFIGPDFYRLNKVKEDKFILVLSQDVLFHGTRTIYLNKAKETYIMSEIGYSDITKHTEVVTWFGKYKLYL